MTDRNWRDDLDDVDIDPNEALAAESDADRNRDPGADLDEHGIPADDQTAMGSEVPDPEHPAVPTDEPVGSLAYGTTAAEQAEGESLDAKLAREQPEQPPAGEQSSAPPAEEAAVQVYEVSPLGPDTPPQADEAVRADEELAVPQDEQTAGDEADW